MQAQHGKHDDLIAPRRYIGASPRRLGRSPRFSAAAENTAASWFKLSVFGELRLNNGGLLAAGENRKLFRKPLNPLPHPAVWLNNEHPSAGCGRSRTSGMPSSSKSIKKQARSENDQPLSNLVSILWKIQWLALEKMRICALKVNRGGFTGMLPGRPRLGVPLGWRRKFDFNFLGSGRWGGKVGSGWVAAPLALARRGRVRLIGGCTSPRQFVLYEAKHGLVLYEDLLAVSRVSEGFYTRETNSLQAARWRRGTSFSCKILVMEHWSMQQKIRNVIFFAW